jgi:hypothetical protein
MWAPAEWARDPLHGASPVVDEDREPHLGIEAVIGDDDDEALACQSLAQEAVVPTAAAFPASAVKEYNHGSETGPVLRSGRGTVDVERLPRRIAIGDALLQHIAVAGDKGVEQIAGRAGAERQRQAEPR